MRLKVSGYEIEVTARKQNKHLRMRVVPPNGDVKVSCPYGTPVKRVEQFVELNLDWIQKNKVKIASSTQSRNVLSGGDSFVLFGKSYKIIEIERDELRFSIILDNENAIFGAPKFAKSEEKIDFIKNYLKAVAKKTFPPLVKKYEDIIGIKSSGIGYRFMTSRWGSCNVKTKHINFSVYAIQKPMEYIEYLVCHELLHILYPNHGKEFKNALRQIIPSADMVAKLK